MIFLLLFIIPLLVAIGFFVFGNRRITLVEFLIHIAVQILVVSLSCAAMFFANTYDVEILNGSVIGKERNRVHCRHSYPCNCRQECSTDSDGDQSCHTECDTCYEHSYDVDWNVFTNLHRTFRIDTIDRQGLSEPPRWTRAYEGEPVAIPHQFVNYIKASPGTLFRYSGQLKDFQGLLPEYPSQIYDYHYVDRLVSPNYSPPDLVKWNRDLMILNSRLGPSKEVNIIVVLIQNISDDYFYAVQQHWIGGKKNDVIVFIGVDTTLMINWVRVMAWSEDELFKVKLRDSILDIKTLDRDEVIQAIGLNVSTYFKRKSMDEFRYLLLCITPAWWQLLISFIIGTAVSIGVGIFMYNNDEIEQNRRK